MCGINGFIQYKKILDKSVLYSKVHAMNEKIVHRGPDNEGIFADEFCSLGMRRLSIIDVNGGKQPIWNTSHTALIVFNGELYNYKLLRELLLSKGHTFYTNSDTEVVLHGIEEYGISFLSKMEGMFAFAIYFIIEKKIIIARDRIGEKPLYYYNNKDEFLIFGSELKSLLTTGNIPKNIDKEALSQYFQLTYIPAPKTIIQDVKKLMPASYLLVGEKGIIEEKKYWSLDPYPEDNTYLDYDKCKKRLREALYNSVKNRMVSDVPIGAFLSGGIDSTIIVGLMSEISNKPVNTFTIGFDEKSYDESNLASIVAKKNKTNHRVLRLDWDEAIQDLDTILNNIDEPFADQSLIATYEVSKLARKFVTVVLTGDAGDELFAGYNKYLISYYEKQYQMLPSLVRNGIIKPLVKVLPQQSSFVRKANKVIDNYGIDIYYQRKAMMSLGFKETQLKELMIDGYVDPMSFIKDEYEFLEKDELTRTQFVDLTTVLEGGMLAKVDRASMLASLETRVPMLDTRVIELAFKIPSKFRLKGKHRKIILKDTFRDLIPYEILYAPKKGFSVPMAKWLEHGLKSRVEEYADKDYLDSQGLFNYSYIQPLIDTHMSHKKNHDYELWTFFVFQSWYSRFIENA